MLIVLLANEISVSCGAVKNNLHQPDGQPPSAVWASRWGGWWRQRPQNNDRQKEYYSGKKKAHTLKNHLVAHPESRRVCYLSKTVPGKKHDKKLADESGIHFPPVSLLEQDTGFQGFGPEAVIVLQPTKKPKGKELSYAEKFINRCISSGRIVAEHVIAGVKRCRIVKDVLRNWKRGFDDLGSGYPS